MANRKKMRRSAHNIAIASLGVANATEARLADVEMRHIKRVLDVAEGNISLAAEILGVSRRTLQRILRRTKKQSRRKVVRRRKHGARRR